ncbi:MAG: hypothetical protein AB7J32_01465 [Pseudonocardia sp.]
MTLSWPNHLLTLDDWETLPKDSGMRLELAEGMLVMTPMPVSLHQRAVMQLGYRIDEQLPKELTAVSELEVVLAARPPSIRVPDVVVTAAMLLEETQRASLRATSGWPSRYSPTARARSTASSSSPSTPRLASPSTGSSISTRRPRR